MAITTHAGSAHHDRSARSFIKILVTIIRASSRAEMRTSNRSVIPEIDTKTLWSCPSGLALSSIREVFR